MITHNESISIPDYFTLREGGDITLVSWGASVHETLQAAERLVGRADQLMAAVRVVAEATRWSRELGGPSEPFPGMTLP